ncbi:MAG: hypothetical protein COT91_00555 [Candidatus Doudnabacteria bacterium CG10_big_fil_rev_8_21_14_0_10_41_10]|uniref:PilN domain-containing protein n=1 Tax=Candidatus Doudnabacteria bacterium CG10_big_fil_rev_8_21_14_0_10_41_10 TaxID=1974551 RepID=A0A2H0VGZ5_9BACT|nr:MAG: hypothetical protein COT91_00555 [Candidatus Doudnabacteria bacterium CG10_big_fil_rev_8_21_14_0_10_41_10]
MGSATNLLGGARLSKQSESSNADTKAVFIWIVVVILVLEAAVFGTFYFLSSVVNRTQESLKIEASEMESRINDRMEEINVAIGAQFTLDNFTTLLDKHMRWTKAWDELSKVTLKTVRFTTMQSVSDDGKFVVGGYAINFTELGKVMLGLENSPNFLRVELLDSTPEEDSGMVKFEILVEMNNSLLLNSAST